MNARTSSGRRIATALGTLGALAALGCSESSAPAPQLSPAFMYVANVGANSQLVRFRNDTATPLTSGSSNYDPNSRASRLVFTSERNGLPQVFISDLDVTTPHAVTFGSSFNRSPSLSPSADSIAFVSTRSGTPRIWVIAAPSLNAPGFDTPLALATGSPSYVPEDVPAWSPAGSFIAFTSTRDGLSQVYVMPSGGGSVTAVTSEGGGAFQPSWSADGSTIYYVAATPSLILRRVSAQGGGTATTVVDDPQGVGGPASCNGSFCLFNTDPAGSSGSMCTLAISAGSTKVIFPRTAAQERQPAILAP